MSKNLDHLGITHPLASRLRGVYRHAWTQSQLTLQTLSLVHADLERFGVRAVAHRGVPVNCRYLGDPAATAVDQVDLLADSDDLERIAGVLASRGWHHAGSLPPPEIRAAFSTVSFECTARRRVAVRWRSFPPGCPRDEERKILDRAGPYAASGITLLMPDSADQLILACARLPALEDSERLRWTLELCAILRQAEARAWEPAFAERAAAAGILELCVECLAAIREDLGDEIGPLRFPELPSARPRGERSPPVREAPRASRRGVPRVLSAARNSWRRYVAACRAGGARSTLGGYARFTLAFYRHVWGR